MSSIEALLPHMREVQVAERDMRELGLVWQTIESAAAISCPEEVASILPTLSRTRERFGALHDRHPGAQPVREDRRRRLSRDRRRDPRVLRRRRRHPGGARRCDAGTARGRRPARAKHRPADRRGRRLAHLARALRADRPGRRPPGVRDRRRLRQRRERDGRAAPRAARPATQHAVRGGADRRAGQAAGTDPGARCVAGRRQPLRAAGGPADAGRLAPRAGACAVLAVALGGHARDPGRGRLADDPGDLCPPPVRRERSVPAR